MGSSKAYIHTYLHTYIQLGESQASRGRCKLIIDTTHSDDNNNNNNNNKIK